MGSENEGRLHRAIGLGLAFTRDAETVHNIGVVANEGENAQALAKLDETFGKAAAKPNRAFRIRGPEMIELAITDETLGDILYLFEPGSTETERSKSCSPTTRFCRPRKPRGPTWYAMRRPQ